MANILMNNIWFRRKLKTFRMPHELSAAEDLEGEAVEKLPWIDHSGDRLELEAGLCLEIVRDVVHPRDGLRKGKFLLDFLHLFEVGLAHDVFLVKVDLPHEGPPAVLLLGRVVDFSDPVAHFVRKGHVSNVQPSLAVFKVSVLGSRETGVERDELLADLVQMGKLGRDFAESSQGFLHRMILIIKRRIAKRINILGECSH